MPAALADGEWSAARSGRFLPPGKTRYLFYRRLGGQQGLSGRAENLFHTEIRYIYIYIYIYIIIIIIIIIISNLSNDRYKTSSKMIPPHSAI
jgi:hypothetical protein